MSEKHLQKEVVDYLRSKNLFVFSINPPDRKRMTYGTIMQLPDLYVVDLNLFIELKAKEYKSAHPERQAKQEAVRNDLIAHGAKAIKITSLEELNEYIS